MSFRTHHVAPSPSDAATPASGNRPDSCGAKKAPEVVRHANYTASRGSASRRRGRVDGDGPRRRRHSRRRGRRHRRRCGSSRPASRRRRHRSSRGAAQVLVVVRRQIQNEAGVRSALLLFSVDVVVAVDALCETHEVTAATAAALPPLGRDRRRLSDECAQRAGGEGRENLGQRGRPRRSRRRR